MDDIRQAIEYINAQYAQLQLHHIKGSNQSPPSSHPLVLYAFTEDPEVKQARTWTVCYLFLTYARHACDAHSCLLGSSS